MKTYNIFTNETDSLPKGKADFLLMACVNSTSNSNSDKIKPTLDAEFISNETLFTENKPIQTLHELPSAVVISRAVHNLIPFSNIETFNLGLYKEPQNSTCNNFDIDISDKIDAKKIFAKGMRAGDTYELKGNYLIMGDSTVGSCAKEVFLSLSNKKNDEDNFEVLSKTSDNMLMFCAGFIMSASKRFHIVLAGDIQMATSLFIADKLKNDVLMRVKSDNITIATTSWITNDKNLLQILSCLSYKSHSIYTTFSFEKTEISVLKKYTEIKDSVGVGGALAYACANDINNQELLEAIEYILYSI